MGNRSWMAIPLEDLAHVAAGYSSCIADGQLLRLADGTVMSATAIADAVRAGRRIDFRTPDVSGVLECANPVIGVVRTFAKAVRIRFADGRSVDLTTGHVLPLTEEWLNTRDWHAEEDSWLPVRQQWIIRVGQVRPGMELFDGYVESIQSLGRVNAVRLWTAHPAWLPTAEGLMIGSRWHEVLPAWATTEDGVPDYEAYPEVVPVMATGWIWGTGETTTDYGGEEHLIEASRPVEGYKDVWQHRQVRTAGLSWAGHIRHTFARRLTTGQGAIAYLPKRQQRQIFRGKQLPEAGVLPLGTWGDIFGDVLARVKPSPSVRLVWSNPDRLTDLLISGSEVVGESVVARHLAVAV